MYTFVTTGVIACYNSLHVAQRATKGPFMSKFALYCRTSTQKQEKGLEAQERALREYCLSRGLESFDLYRDFGVSGAKTSRPDLDRLMESCQKGEVETVIVYSFSRFARSTKHLLAALDEFNELGITFISISEQVDTSTPMGKAMFTIISAISQLERELVSERVKNGLKNARAKGKKIGRRKKYSWSSILALREKGSSYREIAKICDCSMGTIYNAIKKGTPPLD